MPLGKVTVQDGLQSSGYKDLTCTMGWRVTANKTIFVVKLTHFVLNLFYFLRVSSAPHLDSKNELCYSEMWFNWGHQVSSEKDGLWTGGTARSTFEFETRKEWRSLSLLLMKDPLCVKLEILVASEFFFTPVE